MSQSFVARRHWASIGVVLLPVVVQAALLAWRLIAWVPVWAWYPDPGYQYLLNGGVIITGGSPAHTDHPGTSLQWVVGVIEIGTYWIRDPGMAFHRDLVSAPEAYAHAASAGLALLFVAALAFAALRLRRWLGTWPALLFGLLMLWMLSVVSLGVPKIVPEALTLIVAVAVIGVLAPVLGRRESPLHASGVVALAVLCAVGLSAKILFLPVVVVVLLLLRWRQSIAMVLLSAVSIVVIMIPIAPRVPGMLSWFRGIVLSPGRHGQAGEVHPWQRFTDAMEVLHLTVRWLAPVVAVLLVGAVIIALLPAARRAGWWRPVCALLVGCALAIAPGFKQSETRDFILLIPLLAGLAAVAIAALMRTSPPRVGRSVTAVALVISGFLAAHGVVGAVYEHRIREASVGARAATGAQLLALAPAGHAAMAYDAWTIPTALSFADDWTPGVYAAELAEAYGGDLYFDIWRRGIFRGTQAGMRERLPCDEIRRAFDSAGLWMVTRSEGAAAIADGAIPLEEARLAVGAPRPIGDTLAYRVTDVVCAQ